MRRYVWLWAALFLSSCTFHAYSPPARVMLLESAQTVGKDRTAIAVEGGGGGGSFTNYAAYGTLRVRRGFTENVEGSLDVSAGYLDGSEFSCTPEEVDCAPGRARGGGGALRFGTKWAPWRDYFAITGGLGGGGSLFGGHFALDLGMIGSYDNPYVIPFVTTNLGVSLPFSRKTLHYGTTRDAADTTMSWTTSAGLRVPVTARDAVIRGAILGGLGVTYLYDGDDGAALWLASLAGEVSF